MFTRTAQVERIALVVAALVVPLLFASLVVPFAHDGLPGGHDATAHITYTYLFDRALSDGQLPVRWVAGIRAGESQPLFNFYPPGFYYLIQIVHLAGVPLSLSLKATVLLMWWGGAAFMYAWLAPLGRLPAALAAVVFAFSPYVILDAFVRASYPELTAIAWVPLILWAVDRVAARERLRDACLLAVAIGALLLCHLLTSLIFLPVLAGYVLLRLWQAPSWRTAILVAWGVFVGAGLAAFYVVPSMLELGHVSIGRMTSGDADYQRHFVAAAQWVRGRWGYGASVPGSADGLSFRFDVVQWLALAAAPLIVATARRRGARLVRRGDILFWLAAVLAAMFLTTSASGGVWRTIPGLPYLQFPWRYLMVVSVGAAALAGLLLATVERRATQAVIVIAIVVLQYGVHTRHLEPIRYFTRQDVDIDSRRWPDVERYGVSRFIERGFMPADVREPPPHGLGRWTIVDGTADVALVEAADTRLELGVAAAGGATIRLNTHAFPGWRLFVDEEAVEVAPDERYGFMLVQVPAGTHRVRAVFTSTPVRTVADAVSAASIGLCLGGVLWSRERA